MQKWRIKEKGLTVATAVLTVVLVFNIVVCVGSIIDAQDMGYNISGDSLLYSLTDGDYGQFCRRSKMITAEQREESATMEEYYCIGEYYEAASLWKAYGDDPQRQSQYAEKMDTARSGVFLMDYALDDIDEIFGIS